MRYLWVILIVLPGQGCITTKTSYEATHHPGCAHEVQQQLKTQEDWERWEQLRKYNDSATFIIEDR